MRQPLVVGVLSVLALISASSIGAPTGHTAATSVAWESDFFHSPSGNIRCRYFYEVNPLVACTTLNDGAMAGVRLCCGRGIKRRYTNRAFPPGPVLRYGERWTAQGEFRCRSSFDGMECWSLQSGHGFFINRDSWSTY